MAVKTKYHLKAKVKDAYLELVLAFPLTSIQSEEHLQAAQEVMDRLLTQGDLDDGAMLYLDALSDLVASYEDEHHPIAPASDADMLRHLLDMKGVTPAEVSKATGIPKSSMSEVMAGKKPFSRQMIRILADYFHVDIAVLTANF